MAGTFAFVTFLLISSPGDQYTGPQILASGIETFQDQGLVRDANGKVLDYWRIIDGSIVRIRKLQINTEEGLKTFDVIITQQREGNLRTQGDILAQSTSTYISWVPNMYSWARQFWLDQYQERFGPKQPDILEIAKAERDMYSGVSTSIMITAENDLSQIKAMFRVVRKGDLPDNRLLDIEANLGEAPLITPQIVTIKGQEVAIGDYVELKSMTVDKDCKIDFLPYLIMGLEDSDLYSFGKRTIVINGKTYPWGASTILIEAPPVQRRYYQRDFGLLEDVSRRKGKLSWLHESIPAFIATLKDPQKNKDRFTHSGMQEFLTTPPIAGWNYLPIPSRETKFHAGFRAKPELYPDPIKRELFYERDDVPFYRSAQYPQTPFIESMLRERPVLFHPFDPWKRLGFHAERPALRHIQLHDTHYFVFDPKVVQRADRQLKMLGYAFASKEADVSADDLYQLYGVNGEITRVDDPIDRYRINFNTPQERLQFRRAEAQAFGIPMQYWQSEIDLGLAKLEPVEQVDPQAVMAMHNDLIARGFADTRFDFDAPTLDPGRIATRVLQDPFNNYSEIDWALDYALTHRLKDEDLEFALASALVTLIPAAIHGTERLLEHTTDHDNAQLSLELDRQDQWIERIFESFRKVPLKNAAAKKELRVYNLTRGYSRVRIARLMVDWGLHDEQDFRFALKNAFTQPDLTKRIIDIIRANKNYRDYIGQYSIEQLVDHFELASIFMPNREPANFGGFYGPRDPIFGKNPLTTEQVKSEVDAFVSVLKQEWPELEQEFQRRFETEIRLAHKKDHLLARIKRLCPLTLAEIYARFR